jgi:hypothetical protein
LTAAASTASGGSDELGGRPGRRPHRFCQRLFPDDVLEVPLLDPVDPAPEEDSDPLPVPLLPEEAPARDERHWPNSSENFL